MPLRPTPRYTLVIPTYNRPALLRSLLGYLAARRFEYPVRVLDSSAGQALSENRETIARVKLDIAYQVYDPATPVTDKVALGAQSIETPYCSFCADDDILLTSHIEELLDFLDANDSAAAAHGYYVNFSLDERFNITDIVYWAPSISGDDALKRIVEQMSNYQAVFYAVHRTSVMQFALSQSRRVKSQLGNELLSSTAALIAGGVHRLPHFHMARNTGPSIASKGWHPHHFLATDPTSLLGEYVAYRAIVLEHLRADARCCERYTSAQMERALDLVHLKYLAPMISAPAVDHIIDRLLEADGEPGEIIAGMWNASVAPADSKVEGLKNRVLSALSDLRRIVAVVRLLRQLAPLRRALRVDERLHVSVGRRLGSLRIRSRTRDGCARDFEFSPEILSKDIGGGARISVRAIGNMIEQLNDYV